MLPNKGVKLKIYITLFILLVLNSWGSLLANGVIEGPQLNTTYLLSKSTFHTLLIILGAIITICILVVCLTFRIRNINRILTERNKKIEEINSNLQKSNEELAIQKDLSQSNIMSRTSFTGYYWNRQMMAYHFTTAAGT